MKGGAVREAGPEVQERNQGAGSREHRAGEKGRSQREESGGQRERPEGQDAGKRPSPSGFVQPATVCGRAAGGHQAGSPPVNAKTTPTKSKNTGGSPIIMTNHCTLTTEYNPQTYAKETKPAVFQGVPITVTHLTPILSTDERVKPSCTSRWWKSCGSFRP